MKSRLLQIAMAVITFVVYTKLVGWQGALLVMIAIGWHEMGHLWAAKKVGYETGGFAFLPFIGGVSLIRGPYRTYIDQAIIVIMGPFFGAAQAFVSLLVYYITGIHFFLQAAFWMAVINVFNLLPFSFMDGGQLWRSVLFSINKTLGTAFVVVSMFVASIVLWALNPIIAGVIIAFGSFDMVTSVKDWLNAKRGKTWLCSDRWLYPPTDLSKKDMALTLTSYGTTFVFLLVLIGLIMTIPNANYLSIFIKK